MNKNIFYSWQSDLPNNINRGFIESCIEKAITEVTTTDVHLDVAIDRDTVGVPGTPDITHEIFEKILNSHILIADISFIDNGNGTRRFCNPNVLIELGYAAKAIGWDNIICVFNLQFGRIEELPFDLRHRRPLTYQISEPNNKTKDREGLTRSFVNAISSILTKQTNRDQILEYIKLQLDTEILSIANHVKKMFYGYDKFLELGDFNKILSLTDEEVSNMFTNNEFLGFQLIKDWEDYINKLKKIIENSTFSKYIQEDKLAPILKLSSTLTLIELLFKQNFSVTDLDKVESKFQIISAHEMNKSNPEDSYLLLTRSESRVVDSGIIFKYNLDKSLKYFKLKDDSKDLASSLFITLLKNINGLMNTWGNTLFINPASFRMY